MRQRRDKKRSAVLNLRIRPEIYRAIYIRAAERGTSVAQLLEPILEKHFLVDKNRRGGYARAKPTKRRD